MVLTRTAFKASGQFHQFALGQAKALVATVTSGPDSMPVGAQGSSSLSPKIQDSKQRLKRTRVLIEPVSALHKDTHSVELSEKGVGKRRKVTAKQIQKEVKEEIEEAVLGNAEETDLTPKVKRKQKAKAKLANGSTEVVKGPRKQAKKAKKLLESLHTEETLPEIRAKANKIYEQLMAQYVDPPCPLDHANSFQLLCSVILSAQSTDKKVNEIVPPLYKIAPDAAAMAKLDVKVIEGYIRQIGLAPTKAKNIKQMSMALVEKHGGEVPDNFPDLEALAGVGHKTASVVLAVAFKHATFPVDTHIFRLGLRWGLTSGPTVEQAEADMKSCWPEQQWNALHLRLIYFGREFCSAQRHDPTQCSICSWAAVAPYNVQGYSPARAGRPKKEK